MESLPEPETEPDHEPVLPKVIGIVVVEIIRQLTPTEHDPFIDNL